MNPTHSQSPKHGISGSGGTGSGSGSGGGGGGGVSGGGALQFPSIHAPPVTTSPKHAALLGTLPLAAINAAAPINGTSGTGAGGSALDAPRQSRYEPHHIT